MVIFGGGPSLDAETVDYVRLRHAAGDCKAIGINDAYKLAPWVDVLYAADFAWWDMHNGVAGFTGIKMSTDKRAECDKRGLLYVAGQAGEVFCTEPGSIHFGHNGGFQAINIAMHTGASRILLLGYNMQMVDGVRHWFGEHPVPLNRATKYDMCIRALANAAPGAVKAGVEIINCTTQTALHCFPEQQITEALP